MPKLTKQQDADAFWLAVVLVSALGLIVKAISAAL